MKRDNTHGRAWKGGRNAKKLQSPTAEQVTRELSNRVLSDMDTCRRVWQGNGNPVAVCEAVRQSDLPEWLADAILVLLTAEPILGKPVARSMWKNRDAETTDAARASVLAALRSAPQPVTWEAAGNVASTAAAKSFDGIATVSWEHARTSYKRVARSLQTNPTSYYQALPDLPERIAQAVARLMQTGPLGVLVTNKPGK